MVKPEQTTSWEIRRIIDYRRRPTSQQSCMLNERIQSGHVPGYFIVYNGITFNSGMNSNLIKLRTTLNKLEAIRKKTGDTCLA